MRVYHFSAFLLALVLACGACGSSGSSGTTDTVTPAEEVLTDTEKTPEIDTAAPDLVQQDLGPEVFSTGHSARGYGTYCQKDADCQGGRMCFTSGKDDLYAVCSTPCETNFDCPEYYVCDYKRTTAEEPRKVCLEATYCDECQDDIQCSLPGMSCIQDKNGKGFCSSTCVLGTLTCPAGSECVFLDERQDYFCKPMTGACYGDGTHCEPCRSQDDCREEDHLCITLPYSKEKLCAADCTDSGTCPEGSLCLDAGEGKRLCVPIFEERAMSTCYLNTQAFCEPCRRPWECEEGLVCHQTADGSGFCTNPCGDHEDCGYGFLCEKYIDLYTETYEWGCAPQFGYSCTMYLVDGPPSR